MRLALAMASSQREAPRGSTVFDLWGPDRHRARLGVPRLLVEGLRIAWAAGPREIAVMVAMQVASIGLVVAGVLVARDLVADVLRAAPAGRGIDTLLPQLLGLAAITAALGAATAVQVHRQRILAELCLRHGEDRVLAVTASGPPSAFDQPAFPHAPAPAPPPTPPMPSAVITLSRAPR